MNLIASSQIRCKNAVKSISRAQNVRVCYLLRGTGNRLKNISRISSRFIRHQIFIKMLQLFEGERSVGFFHLQLGTGLKSLKSDSTN